MADHERTSGDARILGRRIHYVARGTGRPVLLVHGLGATGHIWEELQIPGYQLISIDLPGYGWSESRANVRSLHDLAFVLDAFMEACFPAPYAVMGHSLGGLVTLELALARPERVNAAVLINAPVKLPVVARLSAAPYLGDALFRFPALAPVSRTAIKLYLSFIFGDRRRVTRATVEEYVRAAGAPGYYAATLAGLRGIAAWAHGERLKTLRVPTAVVWGARDRIFPVSLGRRLAESLPGGIFHSIQGCGHSPPEEAPAQLAEYVRAFFDANATPRTGPAKESNP